MQPLGAPRGACGNERCKQRQEMLVARMVLDRKRRLPAIVNEVIGLPVLDHQPTEQLAVHAVYLPDGHPPAKVRTFIDFLAEQLAPEPP